MQRESPEMPGKSSGVCCVHHEEERKKHRCEELERKKERDKKRKREGSCGEKVEVRNKESKGKRKKEKKKETLVSRVELTIQCNGSHHVNIITKMPLKTELWKLKTHFKCFQFP